VIEVYLIYELFRVLIIVLKLWIAVLVRGLLIVIKHF